MNILAADIGGTNTRLIYAIADPGFMEIIVEKAYSSLAYHDFNEVLRHFIDEFNLHERYDAACFAVAGPVEPDHVKVTNLPWELRLDKLQQLLKIEQVCLINDFYAVAYGLSYLSDSDLLEIQPGLKITKASNAVVVGAGTGLGAAYIAYQQTPHSEGVSPHVYTTEAGHAGFAPENPLQSELLMWMQRQYKHVSQELLLSGAGIARLYQFFTSVKKLPGLSGGLHIDSQPDPAEQIVASALSNRNEACVESLNCFVDIYASAVANIVLNHYPVQQVYIAGGIAPKIRQKLQSEAFLEVFRSRGKMSSAMEGINIQLVLQDKVGLLGALRYGATRYHR